MSAGASASAALSKKPNARDLRRYTGRFTGPQQFDNFNFTALASRIIPKPMPLAQPLSHIMIEWKGRVVIATANFTSVDPESVLNIIQNVQWTGTHATLSNQTPWNGPF